MNIQVELMPLHPPEGSFAGGCVVHAVEVDQPHGKLLAFFAQGNLFTLPSEINV